jgi:nucleoside phosphorylase
MKYVVLWDEADKRGWLVNGASALLHLVLASIERDSQGPLRSHFLFKKNELRGASDPDDVFAAMSVLCNPNNWSLKIFPSDGGHVLLKHRIESLFEYLEKMMDYQTKIFQERVSSSRSNEAPRSQLEGWDFQDLASGRDVIVSRAAHIDTMGKGWIDFTRSIRAITLFGRQFGELIKPAANVGCSHWAQVPERHFYLAASVADIQAIMRMDGDDEVNPRKLCNGVFWYHSEKVFDLCKCKGNGLNAHHDAVQSLMPSHLVKRLVPRPSLELKVDGAVIFGHNRDSGWTWNDTGDPREGVSDLLYPVEKPYTTLPDNERQETSNFSAVSSSGGKSSTYLRNGSFSIDTATTQTSVSEVHTDETGRLQCPLETKIFSRNDYRVGIICALPKELKAVRALFDSKHNDMNVPRDTNRYALGRMGQCNVVAACLPSGEYGTNSAAAVSAQMRLSFRQLQFCLLVGIGGGVPSDEHDIRLGDVVVSHPREAGSGVIQYDLGKARRGNFKTTGHLQAPPRLLMSAISDILSNPDISPNVLEDDIKMISDRHPEYKCPDVHKDTLYKASYMHNPRYKSCQQCKGGEILRNPRTGSYPLIHYGLIASGNSLMRDGRMRDRLGKKHNVLCFEMEAAGVVNTIPCLVIRGICDYCDSHKNKLWQEYAAATAAAYAKLLLSIACHIDDSEGISQM